jgi:hypothetical protein
MEFNFIVWNTSNLKKKNMREEDDDDDERKLKTIRSMQEEKSKKYSNLQTTNFIGAGDTSLIHGTCESFVRGV